MNTYNSLINNLETLDLNRFKENIDQYLNLIAEGSKTALDAIYELTEMEIGFRKQQSILTINARIISIPVIMCLGFP